MNQDIDITDFGPNEYIVTIDLKGESGEKKSDVVNVTRNNFLLRRIEHCVLEQEEVETEDYAIDWSIDNQIRFFKGNQPPMAKLYGSTKHGRWTEFEPPIPINQQQTLYVELINRYADSQQRDRKIQITFVGMEDKAPSKGQVTK
jgi:hypothetical protein